MDLAVDTTKDDTLHVGWSSPSFSSETDYDSSYIPYAWCRVMKDVSISYQTLLLPHEPTN